jgi:hypothetical protein
MLACRGKVQSESGVIHVVAEARQRSHRSSAASWGLDEPLRCPPDAIFGLFRPRLGQSGHLEARVRSK